MKKHKLKTWPVYFGLTWEGKKNCEIRIDDRSFEVGDAVDLREWDPSAQRYTGRYCGAVILAIFHNITGLARGYCLLVLDIVVREDDPTYTEE